MAHLLGDLRIGLKLAFGMGAMLVLLVIGIGMNGRSIGVMESDFGLFDRVSQQAMLVRDLDTALLSQAVSVRDYVVQDTPENLARLREAQGRLSAAVKAVQDGVADIGGKVATGSLTSLQERYAGVIDRAVALIGERNRLLNEELSPQGTRISNMIEEAVDLTDPDDEPAAYDRILAARDSFMSSRMYTYWFLFQSRRQEVDRLMEGVQKTAETLKAAEQVARGEEVRGVLAAAVAELAAYRGGLERLVGTVADRAAAVDELVDVRNAVIKAVDAIREGQEAVQEAARSTVRTEASTAKHLAWLGLATALAIGALVAFLLTRLIARPVREMTAAMTALANGDTDIVVPARGRGDEIGAMSEAVRVFRENAVERQRLEAERAAQAAERERRSAAVERLVGDFDRTVSDILGTFAAAAADLGVTAREMAALTERTTDQSAEAAGMSARASANVQAVAGAAEEMAASGREIGRQVARSTGIANRAADEARTTSDQVRELAEAVQRIGDVADLINGIASQTNLLALNATIEAARAGEMGKGFAVVAAEVKALASQTAKATEEISQQIGGIRAATRGTVAAIDGIGGTIREINDISTAIAAAVEEQTATTGEIARNVQQAAQGTLGVSATIARVNGAAGETGEASERVRSAVDNLASQSDLLRRRVEGFLSGIRGV